MFSQRKVTLLSLKYQRTHTLLREAQSKKGGYPVLLEVGPEIDPFLAIQYCIKIYVQEILYVIKSRHIFRTCASLQLYWSWVSVSLESGNVHISLPYNSSYFVVGVSVLQCCAVLC